MGEADVNFLKEKCNRLIEKALQLETEDKEKEQEIQRLKLKKQKLEEQLEMMHRHKEDDTAQIAQMAITNTPTLEELQPIEEKKINATVVTVQQSNQLVPSAKIYEILQILSSQMDNQEKEEIVVRNLSAKAKIIELFADAADKFFKLLILGVVMALVSLAVTVLLNGELRNTIFNFIRNCVG